MDVTTINKLLAMRASIWEGIKATLDAAAEAKRELTVEENTAVDARNADMDAIDQRIAYITETEQRGLDAAASIAKLLDGQEKPPSRSEQLRKWLQGETRDKAFDVTPGHVVDFRALSKLTAAAGANTVKTSFYEQLIAHMIEVSGVLASGPTVLHTTSGEQIQLPKTTAHSTATLTAEAGTIGASDPTFGQVPLDAYKYAFLLQVSNELLTDTSVDLEGYLSMQAGRALGNAAGAQFITGTGTSQPQGVVPVATVGVTGGAGVVGVFTADNLIDLFYSVISPYRASSSCGWLLKDSSMATVRKLKDSQNRYLFEPSLVAGTPDTLLGKPIRTDPFVAATALSAKSVVFGDWSQFFVRFAGGVRFERSDDYAFNTDLVTYRAIIRADSELPDITGALKVFVGNAA